MKWWYVLVLVFGVGIGWWLLSSYGEKRSTPVAVVQSGTIEKEVLNLPTLVIPDNKGKDVSVISIQGVVQNWSPETGEIEFMREKKLWKLSIDPSEAIIFVPSLVEKDRIFMVSERSGFRWTTAFCPGDEVDIRLNGDKVVAISNGGYRTCGFKGE